MKRKELECHEYCLILPLASHDELTAMANSIKAIGQKNPIVVYQGKILDGRSRYRACLMRGVKPLFRDFCGTELEALEYVEAQNLHRRHLNQSQKALVAAEIQDRRVRLGANRKEAERVALALTGASLRTKVAIGRIAERDPEAIEKIRIGEKTVGEWEREHAAPKTADVVVRHLRDCRAAARMALSLSRSAPETGDIADRIQELVDCSSKLVDAAERLASHELISA